MLFSKKLGFLPKPAKKIRRVPKPVLFSKIVLLLMQGPTWMVLVRTCLNMEQPSRDLLDAKIAAELCHLSHQCLKKCCCLLLLEVYVTAIFRSTGRLLLAAWNRRQLTKLTLTAGLINTTCGLGDREQLVVRKGTQKYFLRPALQNQHCLQACPTSKLGTTAQYQRLSSKLARTSVIKPVRSR